MRYRKFLSLKDDEICFILKDIFNAEKIENIQRDEKYGKITCDITTGGWTDGEPESFSLTDEVTLREPTLIDCGLQIDFPISEKEKRKWRQYCLAKGCNAYLKDNPYLDSFD